MRLSRVLFAAIMLPLGAVAQDFDYTFVEAAYFNDAAPFEIDSDGFTLAGAVEITDTVFLLGEYASYDFDGGVDATTFILGAGMRRQLLPELDLVGELGWVRAEIDRPSLPDVDDNGFMLGVGVRARVHDQIEAQAGVRHMNFDDSETYLTLAGRYYLTDTVAAGLGLDVGDDIGWRLTLRAEFGRR